MKTGAFSSRRALIIRFVAWFIRFTLFFGRPARLASSSSIMNCQMILQEVSKSGSAVGGTSEVTSVFSGRAPPQTSKRL